MTKVGLEIVGCPNQPGDEYRPAWEVTPGWWVRMADGRWVPVTHSFELAAPGKPDVVDLWVGLDERVVLEASDLIMSRLPVIENRAGDSCIG